MDYSATCDDREKTISLSDQNMLQILEVLPCGDPGFRQYFAINKLRMDFNRYKCTENDEVKCKPIMLSCLVQWRDKDPRNNASALVRLLDEASEHGPIPFHKSGYAFLRQRCLEKDQSFIPTQEYLQSTSFGQTSDGNNCPHSSGPDTSLDAQLSKLATLLSIDDITIVRRLSIEYMSISHEEYERILEENKENIKEVLYHGLQVWKKREIQQGNQNIVGSIFHLLERVSQKENWIENSYITALKKCIMEGGSRPTQQECKRILRKRKDDQKPYDRKIRNYTNISFQRQTSTANQNVSIPYPEYGKYILTRSNFCPKSVYQCLMGCRKTLGKIPPNDLVIVTRNKYPGKKIGNFYFHFNEECLKKIDPHFMMDMIELSDDIKEHLTDEHWDILRRHNVG